MKTKQDIITILSEIIGEKMIYECDPGVRVNRRFYIYGLFIADDELEIKDVHGKWRKLVTDGERWTTVELDNKDNWQEVEQKWADENEIFLALEDHFELTTVLLQAA